MEGKKHIIAAAVGAVALGVAAYLYTQSSKGEHAEVECI